MQRAIAAAPPHRSTGLAIPLTFALLAALAAGPVGAAAAPPAGGAWKKIAKDLRKAAALELKADYLLARARAMALGSEEAREEALDEAAEAYAEEKGLPDDQYEARLDLAEALGEDAPPTGTVDPADFVAAVTHPLMPLSPGSTWTYSGETEDGTETVVVEVLEETKEILGVTCTVVRDTASLDGEVVEDTYDWFAQDVDGNVWYFGEISFNYEDGEIVDVEGSWKAGVDGAVPGIVMKAAPAVGDVYRLEFLLGEAEDWAEVLALDAVATVPFGGERTGLLKTLDASTLEPDALEHKYYAPGIGFILEVKPETGERLELVDFQQ